MRKFLAKTVALAVAIAGINASAAEAITWTLNNVEFSDSSTASGTFDYDAPTGSNPDGTYSNINIVTDATTYTSITSGSASGFTATDSSLSLIINFNGQLSDAGGTVPISFGIEFGGSIMPRTVNLGNNPTVTATPIPFEFEASAGLVALGGMAGGYAYRKKRKANKSKLVVG
jgi:hypothetical protein